MGDTLQFSHLDSFPRPEAVSCETDRCQIEQGACENVACVCVSRFRPIKYSYGQIREGCQLCAIERIQPYLHEADPVAWLKTRSAFTSEAIIASIYRHITTSKSVITWIFWSIRRNKKRHNLVLEAIYILQDCKIYQPSSELSFLESFQARVQLITALSVAMYGHYTA